jgi:RNA polymerase sigma factor (sigma-70 family)
MTDQELALGCVEGRKDAQQRLWKLYSRKMMSVCLRYCDSREEAEDVLQEGFIKVFDKIGQWHGSGPLGGWIRTVMVNTALTHLRNTRKWRNSVDIDAAEDLDAEDVDAVSKMNEETLLKLIEQMPPGYRTVFNLFAIEGYSHKEIADAMGITENTSKTQFLKAKNWLKKNLIITEKNIETY